MSKNNSIAPALGTAGGAITGWALTGGSTIGFAAAGGILGTFGMPVVISVGVAALAGRAIGSLWADANQPVTKKVVNVTPPRVAIAPSKQVVKAPVRKSWESSEVHGTFTELY